MRAKQISQYTLILLIISAIDNIRNLPQIALFGTTLIFFFALSALFFLIPVALVSAQLSASSQEQGGIYHWTCMAFGPKIGLIAVWLQWINTLVWFPSILSFIAATATYFFNPALASNKTYLVSVILVVFWGMTFMNLAGVRRSASLATIFSVLGALIPIGLIIGFAVLWVVTGRPLQIHFNLHNLLPTFNHAESFSSLTALTAIMTSFLGVELATVHINDVKNPEKSFPRALGVSVLIILGTMTLGSLGIALVLPLDQINLVDGVMQIFTLFSKTYHFTVLIPVIMLMIICGGLGGMISYIISPVKGILQVAESGYLPPFFTFKNRHGVPTRLLITQAMIVSLVCSAWGLMPSVNGSYWLLTDLSTELYILMYVFMFLAALKLKIKIMPAAHLFKIPGGIFGTGVICFLGLVGCIITLVVGFIPPSNIDVGSNMHYFIIFASGVILMILPVFGFYAYKKNQDSRG
ncbi:MAG: APC family permease [Verrucomicrobiae bacterium]|jgi:amino acid transporter|nr:APC family permease [Verrucomicrobiae bacterium]